MKKMCVLGLLALVLCSCSKGEEGIEPQEVSFTLDYTFAESGSMTRAGSDVYNSFYENYIKTKRLTPKTFSLTLTHIDTGATASVNGLWDNKDVIRLIEGEYLITGYSIPVEPERQGIPSDSVYLSFNENVRITKDMTSINLKASYDSYLLLFDSDNFQDIYYYNNMELVGDNTKVIKKGLYLADTHYALFIRDLNYGVYDDDLGHYIKTTRIDGSQGSITLDNFPFEKGKYYYFHDMTNSFDIPPMESGN